MIPLLIAVLATAEPATQAQIKATADAFLSGNRSELHWRGYRELAKLEKGGPLVEQLAVYAATAPGQEMQPVMEALMVLNALDLEPAVVIPILAPYLDEDNKRLRSFAREGLEHYDDGQFINYVRERPVVTKGFANYLFESPHRAFLIFYKARQGDRDLLLAAHIIEDAIWRQQNGFDFEKPPLDKLTEHDEAWVRRYVEETVRRYPWLQ